MNELETELISKKMKIIQSIFDCNDMNTLLKAESILLEETE